MTTTSSSAPAENYDQSTYWVAPSRNFRTSARLHLQHFLVQNTIGYLLEPAVEKSVVDSAQGQQLKVADLACGNGIWLSELHSTLTKANISAQLDGFDINPINFPDKAYLPASVSLKQLDILAKPLPAELIAFVSIITDGDVSPVLSVALQLLKPGGFLQWEESRGEEESRGDRFIVESPSPEISKVACYNVVQLLNAGAEARGIQGNDWVDVLDTHLGQNGFQNARLLRHKMRKQDYKGWTEDYLMVWDELDVFFPTRAQDPNAQFTREAWLELFAAAVKETEQGVVIHQGAFVTAIGQKPL